jgi:hypothetical protein
LKVFAPAFAVVEAEADADAVGSADADGSADALAEGAADTLSVGAALADVVAGATLGAAGVGAGGSGFEQAVVNAVRATKRRARCTAPRSHVPGPQTKSAT